MFEVLFPSCKKQDFSKAFCLRQALGFVYPAILRNNVDVFCIVKGRGLPYSPELLWGQPVGLCLPCVPRAGDQHPAPAGSALRLSIGRRRHCSVPCLAPLACCCSPFSPDPRKASSGTVEHVWWSLSLENMRKKTLPRVFIVAERVGRQMLWEAREEVNSSSVRQQGRTCLAQPYGCWNTTELLLVGGQEGWGWRRHKLGKRDGR